MTKALHKGQTYIMCWHISHIELRGFYMGGGGYVCQHQTSRTVFGLINFGLDHANDYRHIQKSCTQSRLCAGRLLSAFFIHRHAKYRMKA